MTTGSVWKTILLFALPIMIGNLLQQLYNTVAAVVNLVLDLVFVICFRWGVAGAAIATVLAQLGSVIVSFAYMFKKYPMFRMTRQEFVFDRKMCGTILKLAIPSTLQTCVVSFGNVFMQRLVNYFGAVTMAAYTVGSRIENYMFVPIQGLNASISTFTGQNVGAGRLDRVQEAAKKVSIMSLIITGAFAFLAFVCAAPISRLFGIGGETLSQSVEYIHFQSPFFLIFGVYMMFSGLLQGSGDVVFTSCATLSSLGVRVLVAYGMEYLMHIGYSSCWKSVPIGWGVGLAMMLIRFFSGVWKNKAVVRKQSAE